MHRLVLACFLPLLAAACSTQAWYEGARESARARCQGLPAGSYEECMSRVNEQSYGDYRRQREAAGKQTP